LKGYRARRNALTIAKIILFIAIPAFIYAFARGGEEAEVDWRSVAYAVGAFLSACGFVACNIVESKLLLKLAIGLQRVKILEAEIAALGGDHPSPDAGEEFRDPGHPYARDLDIFGAASLFRYVNRAVTPGGRVKMAGWLSRPSLSVDEIGARQEAATELSNIPDWCLDFRATAAARCRQALTSNEAGERAGAAVEIPRWWGVAAVATPVVVLAGWVGCIADLLPWFVPVDASLLALVMVAANIRLVNQSGERVARLARDLEPTRELTRVFARVAPRSRGTRELHDALFVRRGDAGAALDDLQRILARFDRRGNWLATLLANGFFASDFHLARRVEAWQEKWGEALPAWLAALEELEGLVSLATFAFNHPEFVAPAARDGSLLEATGLGHPLIPAGTRVANDFRVGGLHEFFVITGANMAGKSTFLRAVGVNLVLAGAGAVVCAREFAFRPTPLFSSMRTVDDLAGGTSYFLAELNRLKQLVEAAEREGRLFIILDEILKGTNSADKLEGSRRFLGRLLELPVAGIVATHDLELGELEGRYPGHFFNRCFEISHHGDDILYDYTLRPGVSRNMNASILLERMRLC
jgi:hypothetical protein